MLFDFLLCSERSGSNLITQILNAHSEICGPATTHIFRLLCQNIATYGDLENDETWTQLTTDAADLLSSKLGRWRTAWTAASLARAVQPRTLVALLRYVFEREAAAHQKCRLFIKENEVYSFLPFLVDSFPDARFVYLVRDPRDMALSWKQSAAIRGGVVRAADVWQRDQQRLSVAAAQLLATGRVHQTTYERLVSQTREEAEALCRFLGIRFEDTQLQFFTRPDTSSIATSAYEFRNLQRPIMRRNFGKYRTQLSNDEIQYVEARCGREMLQLGYRRDFDCAIDVDAIRRRLLPSEPRVKAKYESVTEEEKSTRARWVNIVTRIRARQSTPALCPVARRPSTFRLKG